MASVNSNNSLLFTFLAIFLLLGWAMPYVFNEYEPSTQIDTSGSVIEDATGGEVTSTNVLASMTTIFFWSFGSSIPLWLNIFLLIPRLIFWVIVYDKIRGI
jgi:hypothetical protein